MSHHRGKGKGVVIEAKLSATPRLRMAAGIRALRDALGERAVPGVTALPFAEL